MAGAKPAAVAYSVAPMSSVRGGARAVELYEAAFGQEVRWQPASEGLRTVGALMLRLGPDRLQVVSTIEAAGPLLVGGSSRGAGAPRISHMARPPPSPRTPYDGGEASWCVTRLHSPQWPRP